MVELKTFGDLEKYRKDIYDYFVKLICSDHEDTPEIDSSEEINMMAGGDVFIVENENDLNKIESSFRLETNSRYARLDELLHINQDLKNHFDVFEFNNEIACLEIFIANNNMGGPSYYIPLAVLQQIPRLMKHIETEISPQLSLE
jgi:hypothetical protein